MGDALQNLLKVVLVLCASRQRCQPRGPPSLSPGPVLTLRVKDLLHIGSRDTKNEVEVGPPQLRVLNSVICSSYWRFKEVEDAIEQRQQQSVQDFGKCGL